MKRLPQAALIIDLKTEAIAVAEATRLNIPILGLVDSNVDPLGVTFPIPGNDDSMRSCEMVVGTIGAAVENAATTYREAEAKRRAEEEEKRRVEEEAKRKREEEERARKEAEEAAAKAAEAAQAAEPSAQPPQAPQQPQQSPPQQQQPPAEAGAKPEAS
jgi:small subunit ribosomal protein S2